MSRIFGTIFPFVESHDTSLRLGRYVANYEFLKALLNYGTFDEFHLYCINPSHFQQTLTKLSADTLINKDAKQRVSLFLYSNLEENLSFIDYTVFHLGGWGYFFAGAVSLRNSAKYPFPITAIIHSLNGNETTYHSYKLLKSYHQSYDSLICTSRAGQEVLQKSFERLNRLDNAGIFNGEYINIPLGFEDSLLDIPDKKSSRELLGIDQDRKVILYLGRLSPTTKGDLYPLLLAFRDTVSTFDGDVMLILAGGIDPKDLMLHKEMIAELGLSRSVRLMINFDDDKKGSLYSAADFTVAPSDNIQETFGISVIESMATGTPVIAADIDGYKELIIDGGTGYKIRTTWIDELPLLNNDDIMDFSTTQLLLAQSMVIDVEELKYRMLELLNSPSLVVKMGTRAKEMSQFRYNWKSIISDYEENWDRLKQNAIKIGIERCGENLFSSDYLNSFSHYPTNIISDLSKLEITESGKAANTSKELPPFYSNLSMVLDNGILIKILEILDKSSLDRGLLLNRFTDKKSRNFAISGIMWLAKYNLIRIL